MLKIKKTDIYLTRSDTAYISFNLINDVGDPVELSAGDVVRAQVRDKEIGGSLIFEGEVGLEGDELIWHIRPEDTAGQEPGTY